MVIHFQEPVSADSRIISFEKVPVQAGNRKVLFKYVVGTLKHYEKMITIGYLDGMTIGDIDPHTIQWFSEPYMT